MFDKSFFDRQTFDRATGAKTLYLFSAFKASSNLSVFPFVIALPLTSQVSGSSTFSAKANILTPISSSISGNSNCWMSSGVILRLSIKTNLEGSSEFYIEGVLSYEEKLIELKGINLLPGQELYINGKALEILVDGEEEVESITDESEFFVLRVGKNYIHLTPSNPANVMSAKIEWEDYWL